MSVRRSGAIAYYLPTFDSMPTSAASEETVLYLPSTHMAVRCRLCCDSGAFVKMGSSGVSGTYQDHPGGGGGWIALRQEATKEGGVSKKHGTLVEAEVARAAVAVCEVISRAIR